MQMVLQSPPTHLPFEPRRPRFRVALKTEVFFATANGESSVLGQGYDVSDGGMALFAPVNLEPGARLRIRLTMPLSGDVLSFGAEVRNLDSFPGAYGVAFIESSDEQKNLLTKYCKAMALLAGAY